MIINVIKVFKVYLNNFNINNLLKLKRRQQVKQHKFAKLSDFVFRNFNLICNLIYLRCYSQFNLKKIKWAVNASN